MRYAVMLCLMAIASSAFAQAPPEKPVEKPPEQATWLHSEADAVGWALTALLTYKDEEQPYVRFVYLPPWADAEWIGATNVAVNLAAGHGTTLHKADVHANGHLLAYRLNVLAPDPAKLVKLLTVWDGLAADDPNFHVPSVNLDRKGFILAPHLQEVLAKHTTDDAKSQRLDVLLTKLTKSTGAIYQADYVIEQLLTSIRGKYPEFRQYDFKPLKHTPLQALLLNRGFYFEESQKIGGDKGALLLTSEVTGKSRLIFATFGLGGRTPMFTTFDFKDERIRPDEQFIRNLIAFEPTADANEVFVPMPNGLMEFVLSDIKGNLQRVAPPNVVTDFSKPDGHTKELEMGMSCVICHMPHSGYRTAKNDMELLLGSEADFVGDDHSYKGKKLSKQQAVDLLVGRYGERLDEPDGILGRARRDFIRAIDRLTDYPVVADGENSSQRVGKKIKEIYHGYRYQKIDADRACLELGLKVPAGMGQRYLKIICPSPPVGEREDVLIPLLKNGAELKRDDFTAIRGELARRAHKARQAYLKQ